MTVHPRQTTGQRQDSLTEQMRDVMKAAVEMGCYDAHQWIVDRWTIHRSDVARAQRIIDREASRRG